uniref:Uncharacterized protein n=1 Tax=Arundo donax TaxID=35708 RepID=A0A0A9GRA3_ARUDO
MRGSSGLGAREYATGRGAQAQAQPRTGWTWTGQRVRPAASSCSHVPTCRPARRQERKARKGGKINAAVHVSNQRSTVAKLKLHDRSVVSRSALFYCVIGSLQYVLLVLIDVCNAFVLFRYSPNYVADMSFNAVNHLISRCVTARSVHRLG